MSNLTLGTVSFGKPLLVFNALVSFFEQNKHLEGVDLALFDNSVDDEAATFFEQNNIPFYSVKDFDIHSWTTENGGTRTCHGNALREIINLCRTKHLLLIDTDVDFKQSIDAAFTLHSVNNAVFTGMLEHGRLACESRHQSRPRIIHPRIIPHYMLIDVQQWRENGLYFNGDSIWPENGGDPNIQEDIKELHERMTPVVFDVGSYPLWQANNKELGYMVLQELPQGSTVENDNNPFINHYNSESRSDKPNSIYPFFQQKYDGKTKEIFNEINKNNYYRKANK